MKSVKKFFFAFFALLMSFGLFSALTNAKADVVVQVTPWTLSFDNGDVFNVMEDDNSLSVVANAFSVTYLDTTGNTTENKQNNTTTSSETKSKTVNIKVNGETRTNVDKNDSKCTVTLNGKEGQSETVTVTITEPNSTSPIYSSSQPATFGKTSTLTFTK